MTCSTMEGFQRDVKINETIVVFPTPFGEVITVAMLCVSFSPVGQSRDLCRLPNPTLTHVLLKLSQKITFVK